MYCPIPNRCLLGSSSVTGYYGSVPQIGIIITFQPFGKDSKPTGRMQRMGNSSFSETKSKACPGDIVLFKSQKVAHMRRGNCIRVKGDQTAKKEQINKGWSQPRRKCSDNRFQCKVKNHLENLKKIEPCTFIQQQNTSNNNS